MANGLKANSTENNETKIQKFFPFPGKLEIQLLSTRKKHLQKKIPGSVNHILHIKAQKAQHNFKRKIELDLNMGQMY